MTAAGRPCSRAMVLHVDQIIVFTKLYSWIIYLNHIPESYTWIIFYNCIFSQTVLPCLSFSIRLSKKLINKNKKRVHLRLKTAAFEIEFWINELCAPGREGQWREERKPFESKLSVHVSHLNAARVAKVAIRNSMLIIATWRTQSLIGKTIFKTIF